MTLTLSQLLLIAIGGALGAVLRFWLTRLAVIIAGHSKPATLLVNTIGCLGLGLVLSQSEQLDLTWFWILEIGVFGGFTTFSTFAVETRGLWQDSRWRAGFYLALTLVLSLCSLLAGYQIGGGLR